MRPQPAAALVTHALARALKPRRRLSVSEWADAHRVLSRKGASEPGRWRTSRTPYLREIMDAMSAHDLTRRIVVMKAAQLGFTEVALSVVGYVIDHAPAPVMLIEPTLEVMERLTMQRINAMLEDTPRLARALNVRARRTAGNTKLLKDFPGGILVLSGANSPASLGSMPIKIVIADEVDRYPWDVGGEGDPMRLIAARQSTFPRAKMLEISTPTIKGASRIDADFEGGDKRRYHVPCPHCGELQHLVWSHLHWRLEGRRVAEVWYVCAHCGAEIAERHKPAMLAAGRWVPEQKDAPYRSYHISALYCPIGLGPSWAQLAAEWIAAQNDVTALKAFINTRLGEPWEDRTHDLKPEQLAARAEDWRLRQIPPGCLILTAGIDTQDDRIAIQVVGWGEGERCWIIDWVEIPGLPNELIAAYRKKEGPLYEYLTSEFVNAYGKTLRIRLAAWDTGGHFTHDVYQAVRARVTPLIAIKGHSQTNQPVLSPRPRRIDVNWRGQTIKKGVALWMVGTDTAKSVLHARLQSDANKGAEERQVRFPADLPGDYYEQLLSEVFDPERHRWVKRRGRRNEALDTWCYSLAAAHHPELRVHAMRKRDWRRLAAILEPEGEEKEAEEKPAATAAEVEADAKRKAAAKKARPRPRGPAGWVKRW